MELAPTAPVAIDLEAELVRVYPSLARRLALVLRDATEAEDIAQAAFARALERRSSFRGGDIRAWFYTIGLRLAFNELRRRRSAMARDSAATREEPAWTTCPKPSNRRLDDLGRGDHIAHRHEPTLKAIGGVRRNGCRRPIRDVARCRGRCRLVSPSRARGAS